VFSGTISKSVKPDSDDLEGFTTFMERFKADLPIVRPSVYHLK
jgi:hypothetical protein